MILKRFGGFFRSFTCRNVGDWGFVLVLNDDQEVVQKVEHGSQEVRDQGLY
jgi:hypothetical protein